LQVRKGGLPPLKIQNLKLHMNSTTCDTISTQSPLNLDVVQLERG